MKKKALDKDKGGRPSKLTPAIQARIVDKIKKGNFRTVAAVCNGIGVRTLNQWMILGKKNSESNYGKFRQAVLAAENDAETYAVSCIRRGAAKDARHAEWWLERKFHKRWGRKDRMMVDAKVEQKGSVEVKVSADIEAELESALHAIKTAKELGVDMTEEAMTSAPTGNGQSSK
jgi:hypothetical protein